LALLPPMSTPIAWCIANPYYQEALKLSIREGQECVVFITR
jgi:hypothetical protein